MPAFAPLPFFVSGERDKDVGQLCEVLEEYGRRCQFTARWVRPSRADFDPTQHAGLIVLGDTEDYWATDKRHDRERAWTVAALDSGRPVLGICFGAQLLASCRHKKRRGSGLKSLSSQHNGVCPVELTEEGQADPVTAPLANWPFASMSHVDSFQEPAGATALVWSGGGIARHCEAFRVGPPSAATYGLQFHPEPTREMIVGEKWFDPMPGEDELGRTVATGRAVLRAWVVLAISRLVESSS